MQTFISERPKLAVVLATIAIAFLAGCSCNNCTVPAFTGGLPPGVLQCTASGTGAVGIICTSGKTYAFVGKGNAGSDTVEQIDISTGAKAASSTVRTTRSGAQPGQAGNRSGPITGGGQSAQSTTPVIIRTQAAPAVGCPVLHCYSVSFAATECASDETNLRVFCAAYGASKIADISVTPQTDVEFDTLASGSITFTGGSCTICDIAYDPSDNAFLILVPSGVSGAGAFQRWTENGHTQTASVVDSDPNENWGYDYVKNWVFTPQYNTSPTALQIVDFSTATPTLYTSSTTFPMIVTPDSGNVDVSTHVAITPNEFNPPDIFTTADLGSAVLNSPSAGMFTVSGSSQTLTIKVQGSCGADNTDMAIDSVLHLAFVTGEFCDLGFERMGFLLLPTSSSGLAISDYAFVTIPNTPDAKPWDAAHDPHPIAAFNDPVNCPDCAVIVNKEVTWLGVIDLKKLMAAPRSASDAHAIDPTYDLLANGVLKYYAI